MLAVKEQKTGKQNSCNSDRCHSLTTQLWPEIIISRYKEGFSWRYSIKPRLAPLFGWFIALTVASGNLDSHAALPVTREYQLKAAFLYNFAKFIDWPYEAFANADSEFIFCIIGTTPLNSVLEKIVGDRTIQGREQVVKRLSRYTEVHTCHILFIARLERNSLGDILETLAGHSVVSVGETPSFAQQGGIIEFFITKNKLHFKINVDAAQRAGLTISSELLKLARIVRTKRKEQ